MESALLLEQVYKAALADLSLQSQVDKLKEILSNAWKEQSKAIIIKTLNLIELQSAAGMLTQEKMEANIGAIELHLGQDFASLVKAPIADLQEAVYAAGMADAGGALGVKIGWLPRDLKSLDILGNNTLFWIGEHYGDHIQPRLEKYLQQYFQGGVTRHDLTWFFKVEFAGELDKSLGYWDLLADHTATKIRELGRISGYQKAGVKAVRIKARLDSRTTETCRRLHGHVISIEKVVEQANRYLKACEKKDKEKIKAAWPWWSDKQAQEKLDSVGAINTQVLKGKIGLPPYHARCRTITVAEFIEAPGSHVLSDKEIEWGAIGKPHKAWTKKPKKPKAAPESPEKDFDDLGVLLGSGKPAASAPAKVPKPRAPVAPPPMDQWTITPNSQRGSNPGAIVHHSDGTKYYAKIYRDPMQARMEFLGGLIAKKLRTGSLDMRLEVLNWEGKPRLALMTKWEGNLTPVRSLLDSAFSSMDKSEITKQYLVAALNANWDVVGMEYDNLVRAGKLWKCIDHGGSFMFRAQGGAKEFGPVVHEFDSLVQPGRRAAKVFVPVLEDTVKKDPNRYISWLNGLTKDKVRDALQAAGVLDEYGDLADTIMARRDNIVQRLKAFKKRKSPAARAPVGSNKPADFARAHLGKSLGSLETAALIKEDCQRMGVEITQAQAKEVAKALRKFSSSAWYKRMRHAQMERITDPEALELAKLAEEYLDLAAYYPKNTKLYRGVRGKLGYFQGKNVGDVYELQALASFSTSLTKAKGFSDGVILELHKGSEYGTTIQHLSHYFYENEVLMSGRCGMRIIKKEQKDGYLYVHVELADVKPLTRMILKFLVLFFGWGDRIKEEVVTVKERERQLTIEEKWAIDDEEPMKFTRPDGSQYLVYPDDSIKEIGPDHPLWNPYAGR